MAFQHGHVDAGLVCKRKGLQRNTEHLGDLTPRAQRQDAEVFSPAPR